MSFVLAVSGRAAVISTRGGATPEPGRSWTKFIATKSRSSCRAGERVSVGARSPSDRGEQNHNKRGQRRGHGRTRNEDFLKLFGHIRGISEMRASTDTLSGIRNRFGISTGAKLRECSVVIIGSTCRICGRDFKCKTDVALHAQWRHNVTVGMVNDNLECEGYFENTGQKCDICDEHLETISDFRTHKRQTHKKQVQDRRRVRRKTPLRLIIKIGTVTMTEKILKRKYLKMRSSRYLVETGTQTNSFENEKLQDDYVANIDLFLANHVMGNSHIQCVQPHTATNRYIVGKFASAEGDAITHSTGAPGRNLVEISNTPNSREAIPGLSDSREEYGNPDLTSSQEDTEDTVSLADNINIHNKENSRILNERERERRNTNPIMEDALVLKNKNVYYSSENSLSDSKGSLACQRGKSHTSPRIISITKQNSWSNESRCDPIQKSNKVISGPMSPSAEPVEIFIDNEGDDNFNGITTKHSTTSLARLNAKEESVKIVPSIDDDVQEVLRITRGKVQSDINHESPNRTEREILVQNAVREMCVSPTRLETIYPKKDSVEFIANNNNINSSDYPPFTAIIDDNSYQLPANVTMFLHRTFDEKLGIYLDDLPHYGIRYFSDLPEINNNNLKEYAVHPHETFFEPWVLAAGSRYTSGSKANDNEATVVID